MSELPDFLVIGAQKAGSTFLQAALDQHPDIHLAPGEVPFFEGWHYDPDDVTPIYEALAGADPGAIRLGIKRPSYLSQQGVAARIVEQLPDARLLVILRNPLRRAISAYFHYMRDRWIPLQDLNEGLLELIKRGSFDGYPRSRHILEYGLYHQHLEEYFQYFPRERFCILFLDRVREEPTASLRRLYEFLDVELMEPQLKSSRTVNPGYYSNVRLRFRRFNSRVGYDYDDYKQYLDVTSSRIRRTLSRAFERIDRYILYPLFKKPQPTPSEELWNALAAYYEVEIERLECMLSVDLSRWLE